MKSCAVYIFRGLILCEFHNFDAIHKKKISRISTLMRGQIQVKQFIKTRSTTLKISSHSLNLSPLKIMPYMVSCINHALIYSNKKETRGGGGGGGGQ